MIEIHLKFDTLPRLWSLALYKALQHYKTPYSLQDMSKRNIQETYLVHLQTRKCHINL